MIKTVKFTKRARKDVVKVPTHVSAHLMVWVDEVEYMGIDEVRKKKGYHDEPLKGTRKGQRSIRLSRSYRAIYIIKDSGHVEFISVEEVSKHGYKK